MSRPRPGLYRAAILLALLTTCAALAATLHNTH
jgi:hypothetical protein